MSKDHNTVPPCPHGRGLACTICYPVNLLPEIRTHRIPARDVITGQLVWSQGYRWEVRSTTLEADGRTVLYCVAADLPGRSIAPAGYRDSMSLGYADGADAVMDGPAPTLERALAHKDRR